MRITRREFVKNSALYAGGMKLFPVLGSNRGNAQSPERDTPQSLEQLFLSPAEDAWPWVYWYGNGGNLSREAITADLEAMHRVGIRGALYMDVDLLLPQGPVRFLTPEWRQLMQHAMSEANRLGITLDMNNDAGWAGSGGPWITPDLAMQIVVWSETTVEGPKAVSTMLAQPKTVRGYYNDIAVVAFPVPPGDIERMADCSPKLTYGKDRIEFDNSKLLDGNFGTVTLLPMPPQGQPLYLNIDFPQPFAAQSVSIAVDTGDVLMFSIFAAVQVSDDGDNYRTIREMKLYFPNCSVDFQRVSARHYRILIGFEEVRNAFLKGIPLGQVQLHQGPRIEDIPGKALYTRQGGYTPEQDEFSGQPEFPEDTIVRSKQILDLSKKIDSKGVLHWDVPPGKWTVLRLGCTATGAKNEPASKEGTGLECDKLSKRAIEVQFNGLLEKLLQDQASVHTSSVKMAHIDSWETGSQNWTPDLREQFQARRGYDLLPYLPILTGRAIDSSEQSERFLWDLRRTVADLLLENYAGHLRELCHRQGLALSIEAYGAGPLDELAYAGRADMPMGEFWIGPHDPSQIFNLSVKEMTSSAHVYGRPIVGAEAFTADPFNAKWQNHPFELKPLGDLAFTWGVNRFVLNEFMVQPWEGRKPGMTLGPFGIHYDRNNTWWEQSRAWIAYLARCQALLQAGSFVADVAYLGSENAPYSAPQRANLQPELPQGYDYDFLAPEVLLKDATVQDGRLVLTSGMSYSVLVLQPGRVMTPILLRKIKELVNAGATVAGPRSVNSPSLSEYPQCDAEVRQLAEELWGDCDGSSIKENRFGKGRVLWGEPFGDLLTTHGILPDFDCYAAAVGEEIRFIHRNRNGDDFYFIASGSPEARTFLCTFRVSCKGKRPEFWWPDSGRIEPVSVWNEYPTPVGGTPAEILSVSRTAIPIRLDPYGSVFVVFRASAEPQADPIVSIQRNGAAICQRTPVIQYHFNASDVKQADDKGLILESADEGAYEFVTATGHVLKAEVPQLPSPVSIQGPWELKFPEGLGAPDHVTLDRLISWTEHPDFGVKYFSGTATYRNRFPLPAGMLGPDRRLCLDLGQVCVIAEVVLNGKDLGILWKPPFVVDITDFVTAGNNDLEIRVVNLWPNRLIGDEHLPADCEWGTIPQDSFWKDMGVPIARWPQWLLENKPSPTGRVAFTVWKHWSKDDPLLESGLLGPVQIIAKAKVRLSQASENDRAS